MIEEKDFETYFYISKSRFQIFVFDKINQKNLFKEELELNRNFDFKECDILIEFLDKNVFKIEKLAGKFIENIILIIENEENFSVDIAVKKKNYGNSINQKYLENVLIELKDLFKENYREQSIMHMIITDYTVDGKKKSSINIDIDSNYMCLEINFISIANELTNVFDKLFEKYQIKITQYLCGSYIKKFIDKDNADLSKIAYQLKNGFNENEVILVPKNMENKGFFEKFFQLFS
tara:strand:+ start:423 stop:1127 length:705 start_codon:yes stop_codon:yes gene_type:complete